MHGVVFAVITATILLGTNVTATPGVGSTSAPSVPVASPTPALPAPSTEESTEQKGHETLKSGWGFSPTFTLGDIAETLALPVTIILAYITLRRSARDQRELTMLREA